MHDAATGRSLKRIYAIAASSAEWQEGGTFDRRSHVAEAEVAEGPRAARRRLRSPETTLEQIAAQYWPLARSLERLAKLRRRQRHRRARRWLEGLVLRLAGVPSGLASRSVAVRFVALSDTHGYHDGVDVPAGEVLLFLGDAVGNYGPSSDLHGHFGSFLSWLSRQSKRFDRIFFIAGNHETLLDGQRDDASPGLDQLRLFLARESKCIYLQNTSAQYRGIHLFGSPVTVSRLETEGKRYYSRAFEWPSRERAALWARVPEGLDLLMTHGPPRGRLCSDKVGDPLLSARLAEMSSPPRFHVFGHDHLFLGVDRDDRTVFLNVAQDEALRLDPRAGGCALIFDIEAKDSLGSHGRDVV